MKSSLSVCNASPSFTPRFPGIYVKRSAAVCRTRPHAKIIEVRRFAVECVVGFVFFSADRDREVPVLLTFSGKSRMSVKDARRHEDVRTRVSRIVFIGFSMDSYLHIHDHILRSQYGVWAESHMANHKYGGDMKALNDHIPSISGLRWHNMVQNISFLAQVRTIFIFIVTKECSHGRKWNVDRTVRQ